MEKLKLLIIHASTREGRKGLPVSNWIVAEAQKQSAFDVEFADLKEINLPFIDEPIHPIMQKYQNEHTRAWSEKVQKADAFIIVTSEYNYGMPATIKNALDFLVKEWAYKPVAFVGYGGLSGGTRAIQQLKLVVGALKMMSFDGVLLPMFGQQINEDGAFVPTEGNQNAAQAMFAELQHLGEGMKALRK